VDVDAPRALRDLRDPESDQLLGLRRQGAGRERLLIELEPRAIRVGRELPHATEHRLGIDSVKDHLVLPV
jgi:hypothetical protein